MYSKITNPETKRKVNINSKKGRCILENYLKNIIKFQQGGTIIWNNYHQCFEPISYTEITGKYSKLEAELLNIIGVKWSGSGNFPKGLDDFWKGDDVPYIGKFEDYLEIADNSILISILKIIEQILILRLTDQKKIINEGTADDEKTISHIEYAENLLSAGKIIFKIIESRKNSGLTRQASDLSINLSN